MRWGGQSSIPLGKGWLQRCSVLYAAGGGSRQGFARGCMLLADHCACLREEGSEGLRVGDWSPMVYQKHGANQHARPHRNPGHRPRVYRAFVLGQERYIFLFIIPRERCICLWLLDMSLRERVRSPTGQTTQLTPVLVNKALAGPPCAVETVLDAVANPRSVEYFYSVIRELVRDMTPL